MVYQHMPDYQPFTMQEHFNVQMQL